MTVAGNPGIFLLLIFYFFIVQSIFIVIGFVSKKYEKIININLLVGTFAFFYSSVILLNRFKLNLRNEWDLISLFFTTCWIVGVFLFLIAKFTNLNILKIRWNFFVFINVFIGYLISIYLLNF